MSEARCGSCDAIVCRSRGFGCIRKRSEHSSPHRPRKLFKLVARTVARREGHKSKKSGEDHPLFADMVRCANTAVTRGLRRSMRKKIRKGKYVDIFALTDELKKGRDKAKKEGEAASDSYRDYSLWI